MTNEGIKNPPIPELERIAEIVKLDEEEQGELVKIIEQALQGVSDSSGNSNHTNNKVDGGGDKPYEQESELKHLLKFHPNASKEMIEILLDSNRRYRKVMLAIIKLQEADHDLKNIQGLAEGAKVIRIADGSIADVTARVNEVATILEESKASLSEGLLFDSFQASIKSLTPDDIQVAYILLSREWKDRLKVGWKAEVKVAQEAREKL